MQRFLIFILIVVLTCIVCTRVFMTGLEPVTTIAASGQFKAAVSPVFNEGKILLQSTWNHEQLVYLCKILMLVLIVFVAVLNYKQFISEPESEDN